MKKEKSDYKGFTLFEALIAITVGVTLLGLLLSIYVLSIKSMVSGQDRSEITQDSRIIIERLTRDIRQARAIATILPIDTRDPENPAPSEIEIQDGHIDALQYIKYYVSGDELRREIAEYYFPSDSEILVPIDAEDDFGNPAQKNIISDNAVASHIESIIYYGNNPIYIDLTLKKAQTIHSTRTTVYGRNL